VATVVYVVEATGSAAWVAATSIERLLPYVLFAPIGGAVADRHGARRMMMSADLVRAVLMFCLAALTAASAPVALVIAVAFVSTAAGTPFFPGVAMVLEEASAYALGERGG
jgi:MFS transporter, DHA3 family, macrolide efflux protein